MTRKKPQAVIEILSRPSLKENALEQLAALVAGKLAERKIPPQPELKPREFLAELSDLARNPEAPFAGERTFKAVDTCAAEFAAETPYYYSGWERPSRNGTGHEVRRGDRRSVVILAPARTGSAMGSSSTTAACTPPRPCVSSAATR